MIIQALAFYLFAGIMVASGVMVVAARNPVHSVLFLILAFFNAAALFVLLGAEFLAMILVVVYVGAVAVLFLFVVMMLDIDFVQLRRGLREISAGRRRDRPHPSGELALVFGSWVFAPEVAQPVKAPIPLFSQVTNTEALGLVLYTQYVYLFQAAGLCCSSP